MLISLSNLFFIVCNFLRPVLHLYLMLNFIFCRTFRIEIQYMMNYQIVHSIARYPVMKIIYRIGTGRTLRPFAWEFKNQLRRLRVSKPVENAWGLKNQLRRLRVLKPVENAWKLKNQLRTPESLKTSLRRLRVKKPVENAWELKNQLRTPEYLKISSDAWELKKPVEQHLKLKKPAGKASN
mgnify:CR=1 FL=1